MDYKVVDMLQPPCEGCNRDPGTCNACKGFNDCMEDKETITIFDMQKIDLACSTMLSSMLRAREHLVVCNVTPRVKEIMKLLKFDKVIPVCNNVDDAVKYVEDMEK